ncbi:type II toxin-antitoxin system VapC family toxin [Pedobacter duraquae]|uniref:PIN domain-containing protein n=1 Tax=Pedobacter duraquae TaxID=425511 RepID=A0A4R6IEV7_9SPHI|nr:type II toxin-antitoxin system VapC family toxin [Pedobacter duraquae]TDO20296.1 hypothetical protein CLV32_4056 [Pedobacter duraquae]
MDGVLKESVPAISAITEIELLCWKAATTKDLLTLKSFIGDSVIFELDRIVKDKTVDFRKEYAIRLPDAIIAATAHINDLTFISRNTKDFHKIEGLRLINPFEL